MQVVAFTARAPSGAEAKDVVVGGAAPTSDVSVRRNDEVVAPRRHATSGVFEHG
jgi:hypothetical protein